LTERAFCPLCRHENPLESRFCSSCGAALTAGSELVSRRERSVAAARRAWPARLTPTGRALTVGLAVLVAGVASSLLRRRVGRDDRPLSSAARVTETPTPELLTGESVEEVFVWLRGDLSGSKFRAAGGRYIRHLGVDR